MKPSNALRLYRVRLRSRLLQECFALVGIAAGVALLFASQVSSTSLQSSVSSLSRGVDGTATLELLARGPQGFPASLLARVRATPGVLHAAPLLEAGANAIGPRGTRSLQLIGADESLASLRGALVRGSSLAPFGGVSAIVLPAQLARELGDTRFGQEITLQLAGHSVQVPLYEVLGSRRIGALASAPVAIAPLSFVAEAAARPSRLSRILVQPRAGAQASVRRALEALTGAEVGAGTDTETRASASTDVGTGVSASTDVGTGVSASADVGTGVSASVEPTSYDGTLFANAAQASNQSTSLFSAISALVGFLFAFNAMLLTVPARRRLIVELRRDGYTPATVIAVLLLDALVLGVVGCALGLAIGDQLSAHLFGAEPQFLALAFAVGSHRTITFGAVAIAVAGGIGAAIVAVLSPLRDILARDPLAALAQPEAGARRKGIHPGRSWYRGGRLGDRYGSWQRSVRRDGAGRGSWHRGARHSDGLLALAGLACLASASVLLLRQPDASTLAMVLLVAALLLVLPLALGAALALTAWLAGLIVSPIGHVATMELRAARSRAVAIAATGAVAVFGSVAIEGAHRDLLAGLERAARERSALADLWVAPAGSYDLLDNTPFPARERRPLARLPGVRAVQAYRSAFLDYGPRRLLAIAPPAEAGGVWPPAQDVLAGDPAVAAARVRGGGWIDVSGAVAGEHNLRVGDAVTLPTPVPVRVRVAAIVTNLGWAPGAIAMSPAVFARAWASADTSAYAIQLHSGVSPAGAASELRHALGPASGLTVSTAAEHATAQIVLSRQALSRLTQIATLIPIVAVLAMAAAMGAMLWQRRPRLAKLKLEGLARAELWRTVLLEALLLLCAGCLCGAVLGLYGQRLADRALAQTINFPVLYSLSTLAALRAVALVAAAAVAILALPGYLAASVPAALALQD